MACCMEHWISTECVPSCTPYWCQPCALCVRPPGSTHRASAVWRTLTPKEGMESWDTGAEEPPGVLATVRQACLITPQQTCFPVICCLKGDHAQQGQSGEKDLQGGRQDVGRTGSPWADPLPGWHLNFYVLRESLSAGQWGSAYPHCRGQTLAFVTQPFNF